MNNIIRKIKINSTIPVKFTDKESEIINFFESNFQNTILYISPKSPNIENYMKKDDLIYQINRSDNTILISDIIYNVDLNKSINLDLINYYIKENFEYYNILENEHIFFIEINYYFKDKKIKKFLYKNTCKIAIFSYCTGMYLETKIKNLFKTGDKLDTNYLEFMRESYKKVIGYID